ncbi:translation release factor eRF1 family protein [Schizosaccharomyces japonicus yFS275]|uniref:Protein DOM34 homolog n=1 Tax=Schizosaccharomyces japonicus (strain yFS275 / FY16936) TaxID=402676 RepID=B6K6F1_SCHJY|nr:translation release factor eRF1 family protein [Schizosaccharomyces japonicus yFS275]EEB09105.1 translation release factor eRF1 family protein [Schizosaccharomyces japonicus yFS275]
MKLINKSLERDGSGSVVLLPEEPEDMWHLYNIFQVGDELKASTVRRVIRIGATGSRTDSRVQMSLRIAIESMDFDTHASELHVKGKTTEQHPDVKAGSYHTLDLELHRKVTVFKKEWDSFALERVEEACDPAAKAQIGAIVLEEGLANICLITESMTILRQRVEHNIPRKRRNDSSAYQKGIDKFYGLVYQAMVQDFDFDALKVIVLASPGFVAKGLYDYIFSMAVKLENKKLVKSKGKFLIVHTSTGHIHTLNEVLKDPSVQSQLSDTKFVEESRVLEKFYKTMDDDELRTVYGPKQVERAFELSAISQLLISDTLFRSLDIATRKHWVKMVENVKQAGGTVYKFSSLHESGKQLDQLSGIAAILSYPVEIEVDEDSDPFDSDSL